MEKIIQILIILLIVLSSSCEAPEQSKIAAYFDKNSVDLENSSIVILNPDYCGSCTEETIHWMVNHDRQYKNKKYILTTGTMKKEHLEALKNTSYQIIKINSEDVERLGIPPTASTHYLVEDNNVVKEEIIK